MVRHLWRSLTGALALAVIVAAPALAAPTTEQAAQLKALRDAAAAVSTATTALEATLNTAPTPTPDPDPTPTPSPVAGTWALGTTLNATAWNRTVSASVVKPGEVVEYLWTVTSSTPTVHYGLISGAHNQNAGNTNWPGGQAGSYGWRSSDGTIWNASSRVGQTGSRLTAGTLGMIVNRQDNTLRFKVGSAAYGAPVSIANLSGDVAPFVGVENGTAVIRLAKAGTVTPTPTPDPPPTPVAGVKGGVSVANDNSGARVEQFMARALNGAKPRVVWANADDRGWDVWINSLNGQLGGGYGPARWAINNGVPVWYTVPLITGEGGIAPASVWQAAARGDNDARYRAAATALATAFRAQGEVLIRLTSEPNGNWFYYSIAPGQELNYAAAWRRYVEVFRSVEAQFPGFKFRFDFNVQLAWDSGTDIWKAYPGDDFVDLVTADFYYRTRYDGTNQLAGFAKYKGGGCSLTSCRNVGLDDVATFAAAHGKGIGFTEWGFDCDCPVYVNAVADWFEAHGWPLNAIWNRTDDPAANTAIDDGSKPNALAVYRGRFN